MVHHIYSDLLAGHRYGHADHQDMQPAAIFALANRLWIHSMPVRNRFRIPVNLLSQFAGYDQLSEAAAQSFLRSVTKNPCELPVHTQYPIVHAHESDGFRRVFE